MAVVEVAAASAMTMEEGNGEGEVKQQRMRQWTAALSADRAIDGSSVIGCHRHQRKAMVKEGDGDK